MFHLADADTIFHSGRIFTYPYSRSTRAAVAVHDGRILAIGPDAEILALANRHTRLIDISGKLLLPGFQDVHVHPVTAGTVLESCYLIDVYGKSRTLDTIANYADSHRDEPWLRGWGWKQEDFAPEGPHHSLLDSVTHGRPTYLTRADGHAAWVNQAALSVSGITDATPDPEGGRIERDESGHPTGLLHENAMKLVHTPSYTTKQLIAALERGQSHLLSLGITGWQDASVEEDQLRAYTALHALGRLKAHVTGALRWNTDFGIDQIVNLLERKRLYENSLFSLHTVKIMVDGVIEGSRTAALFEPYLNPETRHPGEERGETFITPEDLEDTVAALTGHGFQLHFHAIGDRAVHYALDSLHHAFTLHGAPRRHPVISHIQLIREDDINRFEQLGGDSLYATVLGGT